MMNGMRFGDIHTYEDLNLILSKVNIPPAAVKTNFVDIPGGDGSLDLTEALGEVRYKDRECTFTFTVLPQDNFEEKKTQVSNLLNGRRFRIALDKDPGYYYEGRCSINEYASDKNLHKIVVGAIVAPYKMKNANTVVTVPTGTSVAAVLENGRRAVVPTVTNTKNATIVFDNTTYNINPGTHVLSSIVLTQGQNPVTVTSDAAVVFTYQEGDL